MPCIKLPKFCISLNREICIFEYNRYNCWDVNLEFSLLLHSVKIDFYWKHWHLSNRKLNEENEVLPVFCFIELIIAIEFLQWHTSKYQLQISLYSKNVFDLTPFCYLAILIFFSKIWADLM